MTLNEWVFWIGTAVVVYDVVVAWTHIAIYGIKSRWRQFDEGKALMGTMASYALVLTYVCFVNIQVGMGATTFEEYPQRGLIRIFIFALVGVVVTRWLTLLLRNLRRAKQGAGQ